MKGGILRILVGFGKNQVGERPGWVLYSCGLQVAAYGSNIYGAFDWPNAYPRNPFSPYSGPYSPAPNLAASSLAYGYLGATGLMKPTA